jgi:YVTN family beta-propeller protein
MPLQPAGQASASTTRQALAGAVNPNGPGRSGLVIPIAARTNRTGPAIKVGTLTDMMALTPDGKTLYVVDQRSGTVVPISTATNKAGQAPDSIAISPDGKTVYVVSVIAGTVTPVEVATNTAGPPVKVGANPSAIVIAP